MCGQNILLSGSKSNGYGPNIVYMRMVVDRLPRLGKRELICLLLFACNYVVFVWRGFLFLWVLGMGYFILLWHSLSLPYSYFLSFFRNNTENFKRSSSAHYLPRG